MSTTEKTTESDKAALDNDTMENVAGGGDDGWGPIYKVTRPNGLVEWTRQRINGGGSQSWNYDPRPKPNKRK